MCVFLVQLLQYGGHVDEAELAAKVTHDGSVFEHEELPHVLPFAVLTQIHRLQQVPVVQVPERHAAITSGH